MFLKCVSSACPRMELVSPSEAPTVLQRQADLSTQLCGGCAVGRLLPQPLLDGLGGQRGAARGDLPDRRWLVGNLGVKRQHGRPDSPFLPCPLLPSPLPTVQGSGLRIGQPGLEGGLHLPKGRVESADYRGAKGLPLGPPEVGDKRLSKVPLSFLVSMLRNHSYCCLGGQVSKPRLAVYEDKCPAHCTGPQAPTFIMTLPLLPLASCMGGRCG